MLLVDRFKARLSFKVRMRGALAEDFTVSMLSTASNMEDALGRGSVRWLTRAQHCHNPPARGVSKNYGRHRTGTWPDCGMPRIRRRCDANQVLLHPRTCEIWREMSTHESQPIVTKITCYELEGALCGDASLEATPSVISEQASQESHVHSYVFTTYAQEDKDNSLQLMSVTWPRGIAPPHLQVFTFDEPVPVPKRPDLLAHRITIRSEEGVKTPESSDWALCTVEYLCPGDDYHTVVVDEAAVMIDPSNPEAPSHSITVDCHPFSVSGEESTPVTVTGKIYQGRELIYDEKTGAHTTEVPFEADRDLTQGWVDTVYTCVPIP